MFCQAAAFWQVGGFSQELFASEEIDLFARLNKLARRSGREIVILHRYPLITSARKLHLYSTREHFRFMRKAILGLGKTLRDPADCHTWYDGRR